MENITGHPIEPPASIENHCGSACPHYCEEIIGNYVMPIARKGLSSFLINLFMRNDRNDKFLDYVLKKLKEYENVGRAIYNRPKSDRVPKQMFLQSTIFQLIAADILELIVD